MQMVRTSVVTILLDASDGLRIWVLNQINGGNVTTCHAESVACTINGWPVIWTGDGDLDMIGTRGNSYPYDGVIWLEQVRTDEAQPVFQQGRDEDSQQMPLPSGESGVKN